MRSRTSVAIKPEVEEVLRGCVVSGQALTLPAALDRKLYVQVNDVIERLGGKWSKRDKAHVFGDDAWPLVQAVLDSGQAPVKNEFDFFETPASVIERMIEALDCNGYRYDSPPMILEPSAGTGAIVKAVAQRFLDYPLYAIEIEPRRAAEIAKAVDVSVTIDDFLTISPDVTYDRIIMNPPFTAAGDPLAYITHISHAWDFLAPDGILVAIAPAGVEFREDRHTASFRNWLISHDAEIERLPDNSFKSSGTGVSCVMITLCKQGANEPMTSTLEPPITAQPPDYVTNHNRGGGLIVPLADIVESDFNPRETFDDDKLADLAADIKAMGFIHTPVIVRPHPLQAGRYELLDGARRRRASEIAGLTAIETILRTDVSDEQAALMGLSSGTKSVPLNAIETAKALARLEKLFGWTQAQIGERAGMDQPKVNEYLALLDMPKSVQDLIIMGPEKGGLSLSHGKALRTVKDADACADMAKQAADLRWSVSMLRDEVDKYKESLKAAAGQTAITTIPGVMGLPSDRPSAPRSGPAVVERDLEEMDSQDDRTNEDDSANAGDDDDSDQTPAEAAGEQAAPSGDAERASEPAATGDSPQTVGRTITCTRCGKRGTPQSMRVIGRTPELSALLMSGKVEASEENGAIVCRVCSSTCDGCGRGIDVLTSPAVGVNDGKVVVAHWECRHLIGEPLRPGDAQTPAQPVSADAASVPVSQSELQDMQKCYASQAIAEAKSSYPAIKAYKDADGREWCVSAVSWRGDNVLAIEAFPMLPEPESPIPSVAYGETPQFSYAGLGVCVNGLYYVVQEPKTSFSEAKPIPAAAQAAAYSDALHPEALEAAHKLFEMSKATRIMTPEEMTICCELFPGCQDLTPSTLASVMLVRRLRRIVGADGLGQHKAED